MHNPRPCWFFLCYDIYMTLPKQFAAFTLLTFIAFVSIMPTVSLAQGGGLKTIVPDKCSGPNAATQCGICEVADVAQNLLNDGIFFAIVFSAMLFAWAGWQYMTAEGQPYKIKNAKKMFRNIIIGLLLIVGAWLVVDTLMKTVTGGNAQFGPWNEVC